MNKSCFDCIYLRKSRNDADADPDHPKETLARHEAQLLALAQMKNCHVTAIYREVVSGDSILARPLIQQLLKEVENGQWRSVLVMDLDRLARGNTADQGRIMDCFQYSGTRIITPQKIYDPSNEYDEEYMEFGLFLSRREYKMINRRIQRGRHQSAREGKYIGNRPPYGYQRFKLPKEKGWSLQLDPHQAPIIQEIFQTYHGFCIKYPQDAPPTIGGPHPKCSVRQICASLNLRNIPASSGKPWTPSTIYSILKNPVYAGFIKHGARPQLLRKTAYAVEVHRPQAASFPIYPGLHPALVPKEWIPCLSNFTYRRIGTS